MTEQNISERAQQILKILIERYIHEGTPIGSHTLAKMAELSLSSASIRNVMAELQERGYLCSPYKSAGRIPTTQGYKFFVNSLLMTKSLDEELIKQCQQQLHPDKDKQNLLKETSSLLSNLTQLVSIVTLPHQEQLTLRHIEFLPLSNKRLLVILVLNEKEVQNQIIHVDREFAETELIRIANYLTETYKGKTLIEIRQAILKAMRETREQMNAVMQAAFCLADQVFQRRESSREDYMMSGQMNLLQLAHQQDVDSLKALFDAFTEKQCILNLLDQCLLTGDVQIFIGEESEHSILEGYSVIGAPYAIEGETVGVLGVIGPNRMSYEEVIPVVDVTAKILSSALV